MSCGVRNAMVISNKGSHHMSGESHLFRGITEVEEEHILSLHFQSLLRISNFSYGRRAYVSIPQLLYTIHFIDRPLEHNSQNQF